MDQNIPPSRISPASGMQLVQKMITKADRMGIEMYKVLPCDLPGDESRPKVTRKDISIKGVDGNDLKLHVYRRDDSANQKLPCVVYIQYVPADATNSLDLADQYAVEAVWLPTQL